MSIPNDPMSIFLLDWFKKVMYLKRVHDEKKLNDTETVAGYIFAACFVVADVAYNWTVGTYHFKDLPKETTFTARLKRYKAGVGGWRKEDAILICNTLNQYDPDGHHC